ncbi:MAG: DEAD/DEAH box helicase [Rickettsiales bacterium]|jgi:transcription-repair coupling factor (superfamily II helicase)|nr:DEAD/DEAH box helicase [Rickettsiales bacterium]
MLTTISENEILEEGNTNQDDLIGLLDKILKEQSSLKKGNLVIHSEYGLGRFSGLETIRVGDRESDFLRIEYRDNASLLVPVENCDLITKYGEQNFSVRLDSLGSKTWSEKKLRIRKKIKNIAGKLIATASARKLERAQIFTVDEGEYGEFCDDFQFEPTPDQLRAVEEIRADLSRGVAMDRLLCGDVGYGKTEVAMRAAFMVAAGNNRAQVVLAVPTTLLCRQHYDKFLGRFKNTDLVIESLSRYSSKSEMEKTIVGLENGLVDILICTHVIFTKKIKFKNLGLIIIDEEQKFGVEQKEKIKELEIGSHMLSMTATPIPRTLQMAMAGIRDMSLIATAPLNRNNVVTIVADYSDAQIREAIERELGRDGRVFIVVPRIIDIGEIRAKLKITLPDLEYYVIHGRMSSEESGKIMDEFYEGVRKVLVATTIVENGIDIPLANTLIVYRANNFGLAQLYQLRGRVGRDREQGFAYMITKKTEVITETARRRLEIIEAIDSLGAGFAISSEDMEIRGGGNILGESQTGHMREIGIELYNSMLEESLKNHRRQQSDPTADLESDFYPEIKLDLQSTIPRDYIDSANMRIKFYRKIAAVRNAGDMEKIREELEKEGGGAMPESISNLMEISILRTQCRHLNIQKLMSKNSDMVVIFYKNTFKNPERLLDYIVHHRDAVKLHPDGSLLFHRDSKLGVAENAENVINILTNLSE